MNTEGSNIFGNNVFAHAFDVFNKLTGSKVGAALTDGRMYDVSGAFMMHVMIPQR